MKHKAPQFDLPGTEYVFNLSGETYQPADKLGGWDRSGKPLPQPNDQDRTAELFPTNQETKKEKDQ